MPRILIVDDNSNARKLLRCLLEGEGHAVIECADGMEALQVAERENPNLVITDSRMPGMRGIELVAGLRRRPRTLRTPIIFHTASGDDTEIREIAAAYQVAGILTKPCPAKVMLAEIAAALSAPLTGVVGRIPALPGSLRARIPAYLASCDADLAAMKSALAAGDLSSIQEAGHNLKGTGSAYGFCRITWIGDRLFSAATKGDLTEITERLGDLAAYLGAIQATGFQAADRTEACAGELNSDAEPEYDH